MRIQTIAVPNSYETVYSPAVRADSLIFLSGQVGVNNPDTGEINRDIKSQCKQCMENMKQILSVAGSNLSNVVKVTVYLKNAGDFKVLNDIYKEYFPVSPPARSTIVAELVLPDMLVEIDCIACVKV